MKKGTRICAAGLLALTVALGAAPALGAATPATALADTVIEVPNDTVTLKEGDLLVIKDGSYKKVEAGGIINASDLNLTKNDTIVLGEGTYTIAAAFQKGVSIKGQGADKTTINSSIQFAKTGEDASIEISGLTLKYDGDDGESAILLTKGDGVDLNVHDVTLHGFKYGINVSDAVTHSSVTASNVKLDGVWTGAMFDSEVLKSVDLGYADDSVYVYAVDTVDGKGVNSYYGTLADYKAGENAVLVGADGLVVTDDKDDKDDFEMVGGDWWYYSTAATADGINYVSLGTALSVIDAGETLDVVKDTTLDGTNLNIDDNDVTVNGNGHLVTVSGGVLVTGDNFTLQNARVNGTTKNAKSALFTFNGNGYEATLQDVALNNVDGKGVAFKALNGAKIVVAGNFDLTPFMGSTAEAAILIDGNTASRYNGIAFADDATVTYNDVSWKNIPFAKLVADDKGVLPTVSANGAISVETEDHYEADGKTLDYQYIYVSMKAPEAQDVTVTRLYNPYTGEHLYTSDADEVQGLVTMGWNDEGASWVSPAEGTPVYRLYNPYNDEHHYTTDENEVAELVKIGWKDEGVKLYSAESGTEVYRLFNPYAERYTHLFTTDGNEAAELQQQGWEYEGVAFYGVK